jgi:hypothetical protein
MRRRRYLQLVAAGTVAALAGCSASGDAGTGQDQEQGRAPRPPTLDEVDLPVPTSEMRQPLPKDYIPAIVEPEFAADWSGLDADVDPTLPDDAAVLGITRDGRARAYPLRILNHHEVVNDDFGGPIAVTYCVLCGSAVTFERRVGGEPATFGVSGKLWRADLVMYDDRSETLWSQLLATAINGPRTGDQLALLPTTLTTWGEWRETNPDTRVLLPPPASGAIPKYDRSFDYFSPAYSYGEEDQLIGNDSFDGGLHPKTLVVGVTSGDTTRVYPFPVVAERGVIDDRVGDRPVVVATSPDGSLVAYDRRVDGETLAFETDGEEFLTAGGSRWRRTTGRAVDGPHEGDRLRPVNDLPPMFWYGWSKFNEDTDVYGTDP